VPRLRATPDTDFTSLMEPTARILLGEPNKKLSKPTELRFGTHGSMAVNLKKGTFYDHENSRGGGVLDLIEFQLSCDRPAAMSWLTEQGILNGLLARPKPVLATKVVAEYDYTDEAGALLFQSVRYEPKAFKQRRPDGNGGWIPNLDGLRRVLYRLPDVIEAVKRGTTIHVVEGEKDADALHDLGLVATTNPGGANKWRPEYSGSLSGADVVVICDNDDAGRKHVGQVAENLNGVAKRVRVLDLAKHWPQCPNGGDISDWLKSGDDIKQLDAWIESAPTAKSNKPELASKCASEYKMRGITWFWPQRFAIGKLGLLAGMPDRGKGLICADMAARTTKGDEWPCDEERAIKGNVR
jgi:hypothetical protein